VRYFFASLKNFSGFKIALTVESEQGKRNDQGKGMQIYLALPL